MNKPQTPGYFGEWVKRRRRALFLTQEELAGRAGCSKFALRKIESGERRPSKQLAELLAQSLEISSEEMNTFIRVARGEKNVERLTPSLLESELAPVGDISISASSNHIVLPLTPLVGRDAELAAMDILWKEPHCRLLTLTGMGGIGKSRLAIEFALEQHAVFHGGVIRVHLAPMKSTQAIVPAIADVLGFVFSGPVDPKEQLIKHLAAQKQPVLLVLDNFEHLLVQPSNHEEGGMAELVTELLHRLPNLKILATSRERLNLQGEWTYELHGLSIPPPDFSGTLEPYSAATLFIQNAQRANLSFEVTAEVQPAIIKICQLLEGIPLAIELAAAWVGILSCQEIAREISLNIDFLTTSLRDIPERHRSLRASFDHSWKLLSQEEKDVLSRLSIFPGEFDRNAAEEIAGASLPLLASLVSKSLVQCTQSFRYVLHDAIRQYAKSRLDENRSHCMEICNLHSNYYLKLVSQFEKELKSARQPKALRELSSSLDNIRSAWSWAIQQRDFELIEQVGRGIGWYFELAGLHDEGIEQLGQLIQALKAESRNGALNRLLGLAIMQQGLLYFRKGQVLYAQGFYQDSIAILRPLGDQALLADALTFLGILAHLFGEYTRSKALLQEALEFAQASNDRWFIAYAIYNLGYIDSLKGNYQKGYEQMIMALDMWRAIGDLHYIALGLNFLVSTLIKLGRFDEAKAFMLESIALCEQAKNRWGMGTAYRFLGLATLAGGQYAEAQDHIRKSIEIFNGYTGGWDIAASVSYLAEATMMAGDIEEAKTIFQDALRLAVDVNAVPIALEALLGLAQIYAQVGKTEIALELVFHILNHPSSTREARDRANQVKVEIQRHFAPSQIQRIRESSLGRSFEEILYRLAKE